MLRRCIMELTSHRPTSRNPREITAQMPFFLSTRCKSSNASKQDPTQNAAPAEKVSDGKSYTSTVLVGSAVVGATVFVAYKTGYLDFQVKNEKLTVDISNLSASKAPEDLKHSAEQAGLLYGKDATVLKPEIDKLEKSLQTSHPNLEVGKVDTIAIEEVHVPVKENELAVPSNESEELPVQQTNDSKDEETSTSNNIMANNEINVEQHKSTDSLVEQNIDANKSVKVSEVVSSTEVVRHHDAPVNIPKDPMNVEEPQKSLSESYSLQEENNFDISQKEDTADTMPSLLITKENLVGKTEYPKEIEKETSDDRKIVLDFIEAIHVAEKRQAKSDAHMLSEEKKQLKEKYEKQLKDARARQLMHAEEAAILEKELNKEKAKATASMKLIQEKAEKNLKEQLQRKDEEAEIQLKKVQELAKAELAAAIAKEKSSQIEKMAEADLNINALCMAFYARSEESRQSHAIHKLALGTLALEDALSNGLPIRAEVNILQKSLQGIDKDSLLELAISTLTEETLNFGTVTQMQLSEKFESLKGAIRHFSLIPAGVGGMLAHMVATMASSIRMKEDPSGNGIESLISKVDNFLVDGKFAEAAEALEAGLRDTEAEEVVIEWVRQARDRAIAEQVLSLLQSYATSITFS